MIWRCIMGIEERGHPAYDWAYTSPNPNLPCCSIVTDPKEIAEAALMGWLRPLEQVFS